MWTHLRFLHSILQLHLGDYFIHVSFQNHPAHDNFLENVMDLEKNDKNLNLEDYENLVLPLFFII